MRHLLPGLLIALLWGCSIQPPTTDLPDGPPLGGIDPSDIPDAVPRPEPPSRYGNIDSYRVLGKTYRTLKSSQGYRERGIASWYGKRFHGRLTSNREPYDMYAMSAAHRALPLPTYARVTHLGNGRSIVVRINDRGPFHPNRIIDLSYAAAAKLGMLGTGTAPVEVVSIDPRRQEPEPEPPALADRPAQPQLFLQVGAFANRQNAQRLHARLNGALNAPVGIQQHGAPSRAVYRVRIGPLASVERVDTLSTQLRGLGVDQAQVVVQ